MITRKTRLNSLILKFNGGKNSGNHNPGQGRGIGKPGNGKGGGKGLRYDRKARRDQRQAIVAKEVMDILLNDYKDSLGIEFDEERIGNSYRVYQEQGGKKSLDEYKSDILNIAGTGEHNLLSGEYVNPIHGMRNKLLGWLDSGFIKSPKLEAFMKYMYGASGKGYGKRSKDARLRFDQKNGLSEFIDSASKLNYGEGSMYRALSLPKEEVAKLKVGSIIDMKGMSSWTTQKSTADLFLTGSYNQLGPAKIVFENNQPKKKNTMIFPFTGDWEVLSSGSNQYKITNVEKRKNDYGKRYTHITVDIM